MPRLDFDFNFRPHPLTKDFPVKTGLSAIQQSLKDIVLTNFYERGFNTAYGTNLKGSIFELYSNLDLMSMKDMINQSITHWEPNVEVVDILLFDANVDENSIDLGVLYTIFNDPNVKTLQLTLSNLR